MMEITCPDGQVFKFEKEVSDEEICKFLQKNWKHRFLVEWPDGKNEMMEIDND